MKYKDKTKEQLINESARLHQRIEDLEAEAAKRKKAEEALKVSETRYRRLFETDVTKFNGEHSTFHPKNMTAEELENGLRWLRNTFYSRASIKRGPGVFCLPLWFN